MKNFFKKRQKIVGPDFVALGAPETYQADQRSLCLSALQKIENLECELTRETVLAGLRASLSLEEFGEVMIEMPMSDFPRISAALPRMAAAEIQDQWTGNHGKALLHHSLTLIRSAAVHFEMITSQSLNGVRMLDFGCGYGRLARLMYFYTDPSNLFGVDPWTKSIQLCIDDGLGTNFLLSDYLPKTLPLSVTNFKFIYASSVFTHLSRSAVFGAMEVCRRYIEHDGVFMITVRPGSYWDLDQVKRDIGDTSNLQMAHKRSGFAFLPHNQFDQAGNVIPGDENSTYGDTSMTLDWIAENFQGWRIRAVDCPPADPFQIYLYLQPV